MHILHLETSSHSSTKTIFDRGCPSFVFFKMVNPSLVLAPLDYSEWTVDEDFFFGEDGIVDICLFSPEYKGTNDLVNLGQNIIFLLLTDNFGSTLFFLLIQFFGLKKPLLLFNKKNYN